MRRNQAVRLAMTTPRMWGAISSLASDSLCVSNAYNPRMVADSMATYAGMRVGRWVGCASAADRVNTCTRPTRCA